MVGLVNLSIALWVIGCSAGVFYDAKLFKPQEELVLEFATLVVMNFGRKPKT